MPAFDDASQAVEVLKAYLETQLAAAPHAATFSKWRGAGVLLEDAATTPQKPVVRLRAQSSESAPEWGFDAWRARVEATVTADGGAGAIKGAANPTPSDTLLSRALKIIIRDGYAALRDAGLYACKINDPQERNQSDKNGLVHNNQHVIEFVYFSR